MDGYGAYADLLRGAIANQAATQRQAQDALEKELADTNREKGTIETASEALGAAFATPAIKKGVEKVAKKVAGKVVSAIQRRLTPQEQAPEAEEEAEPIEEARTEATTDLGGAGEETSAFAGEAEQSLGEVGTSIQDLILGAPESMTQIDFLSALRQRAVGDQLEPMRQLMRERAQQEGTTEEEAPEEDPVGAGEGSTETANAADETQQAASSASADAAEGETSTAAEGGLEGGEAAAEVGGETAAEVGIDASLLADPLTAIFGLILGVGLAAAGIGGAESIKNPSLPKLPKIANVSTQYGIGGSST